MSRNQPHILFVESSYDGHHVLWLNYICKTFLEMGYKLSLLIPLSTKKTQKSFNEIDPAILSQAQVTHLPKGKINLKNQELINEVDKLAQKINPDEIFFNNLDHFISSASRKATFFQLPPLSLKGKISGVYHRPRTLDPSQSSLKNKFKAIGFSRLSKKGYLNKVFLLDSSLIDHCNRICPDTDFFFLSDPAPILHLASANPFASAKDNITLLHFGTGARRKGLTLVTQALLELPKDSRFHFICAGNKVDSDTKAQEGLNKLKKRNQLTILNHYLSSEEMSKCFKSADYVMIPYRSHYGIANLLSIAASIGKPIIASDYGIIGREVQSKGLGLTFKNESAQSLKELLINLSKQCPNQVTQKYKDALEQHAKTCTPEYFSSCIKKAYQRD